MLDITLPEVTAFPQRARFYRENNADYVEISFVGSKDTFVTKVKPEHMAKFKPDWDAYCDGKPPVRREGTQLTDLPGLDDRRAEHYLSRNVHTLEELAALNDVQCQGVGHGALTDRTNARKYLAMKQHEAREKAQKAVSDASAGVGPRPAEQYASVSDVAELKTAVASLSDSVAKIAEMLAKQPQPQATWADAPPPDTEIPTRPRGRPRKSQEN